MIECKNLDDAIRDVKGRINTALKTQVATGIKDLMKKHIEKDVYDAYDPTMYIRRKVNGGLLDDNNFEVTFIKGQLIVKNITKNDDRYSPKDGAEVDRWIVPIIENGQGYTWKNSKIYQQQPMPRPFNEMTQDDLSNGELLIILKKELPKYGIVIRQIV